MNVQDRRLGHRIPLQMFLNEYVHDRPHRALSVNVSETGLYAHRVMAPLSPLARHSRVVGLEFELPGTGEVIWARGEICHDTLDDHVHGQGIRFAAMARAHARLLRDYCVEQRRALLGELVERIRRSRA